MPDHTPLQLTMPRERAQQILDHRSSSFGAGLGPMTEDERDQVNRLWDTMPGNTSFTDALLRIAKGTLAATDGLLCGVCGHNLLTGRSYRYDLSTGRRTCSQCDARGAGSRASAGGEA